MCCVRLLQLLTFVLVCTGVTSVKIKIVKPEWPLHYKTCVRQQTEREFITVGWYVDTEGQRMRLDSYGIPKENKYTYESGHQQSFEYACEPIGEPLYVYIYHFGVGKQINVVPSPTPPYKQCLVYNITNSFPPSPLLPHVDFIERTRDNVTMFDHWRSEYFLFTMDYYFHVVNGLPYKQLGWNLTNPVQYDVRSSENNHTTIGHKRWSREVRRQ
ncbi:uncharacterized protein LOC111105346 isoform X3 [Crassostrea virginica]